QPITAIGSAPMAANGAMSLGSSAPQTSTMAAAMAKLTHQGERSRIAKPEFGAIFSFTKESLRNEVGLSLAEGGVFPYESPGFHVRERVSKMIAACAYP